MIKIDHNTFNKNPKLGFYELGGKIFWNKSSALIEGSQLNYRFDNLKWNFNDQIFDAVDWLSEPPGDIRELYKERARQIREKYDYVILNLSGGGDSTTVLYSFIQAGLSIDEVVVRHAAAGTSNYTPDYKNFNPANEFSEYEYAAKPILKWLSTVSPKTKITVHDFSKDILDKDIVWDENFIYWTGDYITPGCIVRYNHATNQEHLNLFDKGKKVGIVFGTDKPKVTLHDNKMYLYFVDRPVHSAIPALVNNGFTNTDVELFYWSPDFPDLIKKQCHIIKRWFELPENQRLSYMLDFWWQISNTNRTTYEWIIKSIIYPDYDLSTFQCDKPVKAMYQEWDYWMDNFKDSEGYKTFMRGKDFLYKNINTSFLKISDPDRLPTIEMNLNNWEFRPCISKRHFIGNFNNKKGP
jgi:hypothetical protein